MALAVESPAERGVWHESAPGFWPASDVHHIGHISLGAKPENDSLPVEDIRLLAALADSVRALQSLDGGTAHDSVVTELLQASATTLDKIATCDLLSGEARELLEMRASALLGGKGFRDVALHEASIGVPQALTVICGPMCTWRLKTREALHSMIAATTDSKGNELVGRLDGATKAALGRLVNDVGCQELSLREAHPMIITRLIACGGEANTFPKHFAYFLPEDEGVDGAAKKKTIAFANVYRARFEQMSSRLGRDLLDPIPWLASSASSPMLLTWLRGHDIGHELVTPDTAYDCWAETFGVEPFMMLQEAVADVFGVLLALTPEWREAGGYSEEEMCSVFLAELLQYLRRGPWLYGDAGAAALELNFLATNGFLDVSPRSRRIRWKPEVLQDGLRALAQLLEREVISAPDGDSPRTLIERHGWHSPQCAAAQVFDTLHKELGHVPSSLAYCDQG